jgi:hypothetical protein
MTDARPGEQLAAMARQGDVEGLMALADFDPEGDGDGLAYKWLCVASDFGHSAADEAIVDLMEGSSLRFDDDRFATGNAHFELGVAYLAGGNGLPVDLEKGRRHLETAVESHYPFSVEEADGLIAAARTRLAGEARTVFDATVVQPAVAEGQ